VLQAFSPASDEESLRLLKPGGLWIRVYPGPEHLYEMRSKIFTQAQAHKPWPDPQHFKLLVKEHVNFSFEITTKEERNDLLAMTPMVWRSNRDNQEQWLNSDISHVTADFVVACFVRNDG
jgi:23S rRNA (guanine745-N1)-methyltransferase